MISFLLLIVGYVNSQESSISCGWAATWYKFRQESVCSFAWSSYSFGTYDGSDSFSKAELQPTRKITDTYSDWNFLNINGQDVIHMNPFLQIPSSITESTWQSWGSSADAPCTGIILTSLVGFPTSFFGDTHVHANFAIDFEFRYEGRRRFAIGIEVNGKPVPHSSSNNIYSATVPLSIFGHSKISIFLQMGHGGRFMMSATPTTSVVGGFEADLPNIPDQCSSSVWLRGVTHGLTLDTKGGQKLFTPVYGQAVLQLNPSPSVNGIVGMSSGPLSLDVNVVGVSGPNAIGNAFFKGQCKSIHALSDEIPAPNVPLAVAVDACSGNIARMANKKATKIARFVCVKSHGATLEWIIPAFSPWKMQIGCYGKLSWYDAQLACKFQTVDHDARLPSLSELNHFNCSSFIRHQCYPAHSLLWTSNGFIDPSLNSQLISSSYHGLLEPAVRQENIVISFSDSEGEAFADMGEKGSFSPIMSSLTSNVTVGPGCQVLEVIASFIPTNKGGAVDITKMWRLKNHQGIHVLLYNDPDISSFINKDLRKRIVNKGSSHVLKGLDVWSSVRMLIENIEPSFMGFDEYGNIDYGSYNGLPSFGVGLTHKSRGYIVSLKSKMKLVVADRCQFTLICSFVYCAFLLEGDLLIDTSNPKGPYVDFEANKFQDVEVIILGYNKLMSSDDSFPEVRLKWKCDSFIKQSTLKHLSQLETERVWSASSWKTKEIDALRSFKTNIIALTHIVPREVFWSRTAIISPLTATPRKIILGEKPVRITISINRMPDKPVFVVCSHSSSSSIRLSRYKIQFLPAYWTKNQHIWVFHSLGSSLTGSINCQSVGDKTFSGKSISIDYVVKSFEDKAVFVSYLGRVQVISKNGIITLPDFNTEANEIYLLRYSDANTFSTAIQLRMGNVNSRLKQRVRPIVGVAFLYGRDVIAVYEGQGCQKIRPYIMNKVTMSGLLIDEDSSNVGRCWIIWAPNGMKLHICENQGFLDLILDAPSVMLHSTASSPISLLTLGGRSDDISVPLDENLFFWPLRGPKAVSLVVPGRLGVFPAFMKSLVDLAPPPVSVPISNNVVFDTEAKSSGFHKCGDSFMPNDVLIKWLSRLEKRSLMFSSDLNKYLTSLNSASEAQCVAGNAGDTMRSVRKRASYHFFLHLAVGWIFSAGLSDGSDSVTSLSLQRAHTKFKLFCGGHAMMIGDTDPVCKCTASGDFPKCSDTPQLTADLCVNVSGKVLPDSVLSFCVDEISGEAFRMTANDFYYSKDGLHWEGLFHGSGSPIIIDYIAHSDAEKKKDLTLWGRTADGSVKVSKDKGQTWTSTLVSVTSQHKRLCYHENNLDIKVNGYGGGKWWLRRDTDAYHLCVQSRDIDTASCVLIS